MTTVHRTTSQNLKSDWTLSPSFPVHILIFIKVTSGKPDLLRYATEKNTVPFNV